MTNEILEVQNIHTYVSGYHILQGVSFKVKKGEITTILGRNGVGKTTLLKTVIGILKPTQGKIIFRNLNITGLPPHKIINMGIAFVAAERAIFSGLTVEENLNIAFNGKKEEYDSRLQKIFEIFPDLKRLKKLKARNLSGGQQKMLAIACGFIKEPELMMLDEPSEGLSPVFLKVVMETIEKLREEGTTILLVEQNFNAVRKIAEFCYFMDKGQIIYQSEIKEIDKNPEILKQYLGVSI